MMELDTDGGGKSTIDIKKQAELIKYGTEASKRAGSRLARDANGKFLKGSGGKDLVVATMKVENFCNEFMRDFDPSRAAQAAGFARSTGKTLMSRVEVRNRIAELTEARAAKYEADLPNVIRELMRIGKANIHDYVRVGADGSINIIPTEMLTEDQMAAVSEITIDDDGKVKLKLFNKIEALAKVGQHLGAFPTRVEFSGRMLVGKVDFGKLTPQEINKIATDREAALAYLTGSGRRTETA